LIFEATLARPITFPTFGSFLIAAEHRA